MSDRQFLRLLELLVRLQRWRTGQNAWKDNWDYKRIRGLILQMAKEMTEEERTDASDIPF